MKKRPAQKFTAPTLCLRVSDQEHAMLTAVAERDGRSASDVIRQLLRAIYTEKFGTGLPVANKETSRIYIWIRVEHEYRLHLASTTDFEITPQASLIRQGSFFRIQRVGKDLTHSTVKQLATAAGIEIAG